MFVIFDMITIFFEAYSSYRTAAEALHIFLDVKVSVTLIRILVVSVACVCFDKTLNNEFS